MWKYAKADLYNTILDGKDKDFGGVAAIKVSRSGTLNLHGGTVLRNFKNSALNIEFANNDYPSAEFNVCDGTVRISNSSFSSYQDDPDDYTHDKDNRIVVNEGATLVIEGSTLKRAWIINKGTVIIKKSENGTMSELVNCMIENTSTSKLEISDTKIHDFNRWIGPYEGVYPTMIHGINANVSLKDTEIYNNKNTYGAAAPAGTPGASIISLKGGSITMDNVKAHDNANNSDGGVMHTVDTNVTIENSTFKDNSAKNQKQTEIDDGQWYAKGGALYIEDDHTTDVKHTTIIKDTTFEGNKATEGGAVFFKSDDKEYGTLTIDITVSTFKNNEARRAGGGLVIWGNGTTAELKGVEFLNNTAANFGGGMAVYFDSDPKGTIITASDKIPSKFDGNKVTEGKNFAGGGLFIDQAHV
ncbi:MAG: hypothetical protein J6E46_08490, partial [Faecalicoccus sp.]|nr:hypothetical protein [Faecalicoccus sp.]